MNPSGEKLQPIKIAEHSFWVNAFLTKSISKLSEKDNLISIIDADVIGADLINLVFCLS